MIDDTSQNVADSAPVATVAQLEESLAQLMGRFAELERKQERDKDRSFNQFMAVCLFVLLGLAIGYFMAFGLAQREATTVDDALDALLTPGPHCYGSTEEMAAARQRALAALDYIEWNADVESRLDGALRELNASSTDSYPSPQQVTLPEVSPSRIVGSSDPGVPPSRDPNLVVDADVCFGVTEPTSA